MGGITYLGIEVIVLDMIGGGSLLSESGSAAWPGIDQVLEGIIIEPTQDKGLVCLVFFINKEEGRKGDSVLPFTLSW